MFSRAVGAAALFVLAAASVPAQDPSSMPAESGAAPCATAPSEGLFGSGPSTFSGPRFWFDGGYQAGFIRNVPTPALLATRGGVLAVRNTPGTSVVLGGGDTDVGTLHGGRFRGGFWIDANRTFGLEAGFDFLAEQTATSSVSGGSEALSRPFFDTSTQAQNVRILNLPGQVTGGVTSTVSSLLFGADVGPVVRVIETDMLTLEQLFYFRYLTLEEMQTVTDTVSPTGGAVTFNAQSFRGAGAAVSVRDSALAINRFYGGGTGLRLGVHRGRFDAVFTGRVAIGRTSQSLRLDGTTTLTGADGDQAAAGGLLIPATNNGIYNQTRFSSVPEAGVKLGFQITPAVGVYVGYDFLYMSSVVRPGDNFASSVNPTQLSSSQNFGVPFGPNAAPVRLQTSDVWIHSVGAGVNLKF